MLHGDLVCVTDCFCWGSFFFSSVPSLLRVATGRGFYVFCLHHIFAVQWLVLFLSVDVCVLCFLSGSTSLCQ